MSRNSLLLLAALVFAASPAAAVEFEGPALRDPFSPSGKQPEKGVKGKIGEIGFTLEGLIWQSERPQAIVSGKIVEPGSTVNDAEVLDITEKGVKMRYKGQVFILKPRGK